MTWLSFLDHDIDRMILTDASERKVAETGKHWVVTFFPWVRVVIGVLMLFGGIAHDSIFRWPLLLLAVVVVWQALWRIVQERRDRFVITNQRIFRVWGMVRVKQASVPLLRILDITTDKPLTGRVFNYGNLVLKSAAEVEGLSLIDHVPNIDDLQDALRLVMGGQSELATSRRSAK